MVRTDCQNNPFWTRHFTNDNLSCCSCQYPISIQSDGESRKGQANDLIFFLKIEFSFTARNTVQRLFQRRKLYEPEGGKKIRLSDEGKRATQVKIFLRHKDLRAYCVYDIGTGATILVLNYQGRHCFSSLVASCKYLRLLCVLFTIDCL